MPGRDEESPRRCGMGHMYPQPGLAEVYQETVRSARGGVSAGPCETPGAY